MAAEPRDVQERARVLRRAFAAADRVDRGLPERWHALLSGGYVVGQLGALGLPCCLIPANDWNVWLKLWNTDSNVAAIEVTFGGESSRSRYNASCLEKVARTARPVVGSFHGFADLFVPIPGRGGVAGFFASGPFCREPADARFILERFAELTGCSPRPDDPELLRYAKVVLATPVLVGPMLAATRAYLVNLGRALSGAIDFAELRKCHVRLERTAFSVRFHATMWSMARGLVDPVTHGVWSANYRSWNRESLGVKRLPTVAVAVAPLGAAEQGPLETLVAERRFAGRCSDVALSMDDTVAGPTEGGQSYFLTYCDPALPEARARRALLGRVAAIERALGVAVHAGVSAIAAPRDLPRSLEQALLALEWAVHKGHGAVLYGDEAARHLTAEATPFEAVSLLLRAVASGERTHRDRALERLASEIVWKSGCLLVAARAYAETIHAQIVHLVRQIGSIEPRAISDHVVEFRRSLGRSRSATEVAGLLKDYVTAITEAPRDGAGRGLARAAAYIDEHLAEALTAREVARTAGYSPDHFTRLLRAHVGRTFEQYLLERRIGRAKELLRTTDLPVARVATASGFPAEAYFFRAFRRAVGPTPLAFRQTARRPGMHESRVRSATKPAR